MKEAYEWSQAFCKFFQEDPCYHTDQFLFRINSVIREATDDQIERTVARVAEPALNKVSVALIELTAKKLESQQAFYNGNRLRVYLQIFTHLAERSKRFRATIRHAHNVHIWYGLMRNVNLNLPNYSTEVLICFRTVIEELNIAFNDEYIYWKRVMPELISAYHVHQLQKVHEIFVILLANDHTFVAQCHSHLGRNELLDLLRLVDNLAHTPGVDIDQCNVSYCADWLRDLREQEVPEGVSRAELNKLKNIMQHLEAITTNATIWTAQSDSLSSSSSGSDEEEDEGVDEEDSGEDEEEDQLLYDDDDDEVVVEEGRRRGTKKKQQEQREDEEERMDTMTARSLSMTTGMNEQRGGNGGGGRLVGKKRRQTAGADFLNVMEGANGEGELGTDLAEQPPQQKQQHNGGGGGGIIE